MENYDIREEARLILSELKGKYALFIIPILMQIFSITIQIKNGASEMLESYGQPLSAGQTTVDIADNLAWSVSGDIFSFVMNILLGFILVGIAWTMLKVVRILKTEVTFQDSLRAFQSEHFGKVFATLFMKGLFLFLWGLPAVIGTVIIGVSIYTLFTGGDDQTTMALGGGMMLLGLALILVGAILVTIKSYSYAMTTYILCDELDNGTYTTATACITTSRQMMSGYKWQLFLLHFSFIGWWILVGITFGLLAFYVIPYSSTAEVVFYDKLSRQLKTNY